MDWAVLFQPGLSIPFDETLNESLDTLADSFAFAHDPADDQIAMDGRRLADH